MVLWCHPYRNVDICVSVVLDRQSVSFWMATSFGGGCGGVWPMISTYLELYVAFFGLYERQDTEKVSEKHLGTVIRVGQTHTHLPAAVRLE